MSRPCSLIALLFCFCASTSVSAQSQVGAPSTAPDVRPPALEVIDDSVQPQVTIRKRGEDVVEEFRHNGRLVKVVVKPAVGVPYTLIDPKGDGTLVPLDNSGVQQISVPMWELGTF